MQALFDEGVLVRNGAVKLAKSLNAVEGPAHRAGDPRRAYRPAAGRARRTAADAGGDRTRISAWAGAAA